MLQHHFTTALQPYASALTIQGLWQELEQAYTHKSRHYHTLHHVEALVESLLPLQDQFKHWPTVVLAIAYHDAVYNVLKKDNEEQSAALAKKKLAGIGFPPAEIERCVQFILATQHHAPADEEINLFTDADLAILGAAPDAYALYTRQIRQEYSIYPDLLYNPGRKKVLQHFLAMPQVYKTETFSSRLEGQARVNLA